MKARELRIGNLVNIQNEGIWQWPSSWFEIYFVDDDSECEAIKPVPLTEEWLLKFGFQRQYSGAKMMIADYPNHHIRFKIGFDDEGIYLEQYSEGHFYLTHLQYVHQLQNLYFALTGKELEVKQPAPSHNQ